MGEARRDRLKVLHEPPIRIHREARQGGYDTDADVVTDDLIRQNGRPDPADQFVTVRSDRPGPVATAGSRRAPPGHAIRSTPLLWP
jgi:hypothetical protein